jgi:transcriptional regulator with XRE-family HTH domain
MDPIHVRIGKKLQVIRKERGLSLDQAAELTGVSKAMIGQIERGDSNPTISILWKIVNGLHLSFTSLLDDNVPGVTLASVHNTSPFLEQEGKYRSYPFFPYDSKKQFELYWVELDAGCSQPSEPHNEGIEEYIFVSRGELVLTIVDETRRITEGSAIRFSADQPHIYTNNSSERVCYYTLIYYPE